MAQSIEESVMENVVVVGASKNEERYSNKAMKMLKDYGHNPIPVAPAVDVILGTRVFPTPAAVTGPVDTVTMYVGPTRQGDLIDGIIGLRPKRVIFNPGSENPDEYPRFKAAVIDVVEACTLVMLRTNQF